MKPAQTLLFTGVLAAIGPAAFADGDVIKGEKVFRKCKACHAVGEGAKTKTGPVLNGIMGASAGRDMEFSYSVALTDAADEGLVWNEEQLTAFLTKPRDFLKGTKMSFSGLRKPADVANLIAYLATQN
ncbi:c-type cytochrome [Planktotalea frisia]|mgnify:CR=1 FL=1|jgi:cytochrome c|uniref:c-type cytochrome n=1 Tax=Planktotalea frisia TaxID=696762 RepID=UPI002355A347|nr:cytochrome c family protein [Planktotalea frisia]